MSVVTSGYLFCTETSRFEVVALLSYFSWLYLFNCLRLLQISSCLLVDSIVVHVKAGEEKAREGGMSWGDADGSWAFDKDCNEYIRGILV